MSDTKLQTEVNTLRKEVNELRKEFNELRELMEDMEDWFAGLQGDILIENAP